MVFFDIAAQWHMIYALYGDMKVECGASCSHDAHITALETHCYLGQWIDGKGTEFADKASYQALKAEHARFHTIAAAMLLEHSQGNHALSDDIRRGTYRSCSAAVVAAIESLAADIGEDSSSAIPNPKGTQELCDLFSTSLGIPVIDQQHALLAGIAKSILTRPESKISAGEVQELISALTSAVELHFETEEAYMRHNAVAPSLYAIHLSEHEKILEALHRLSKHASTISTFRVAELQSYMKRWFGNHLMDHDYHLIRHLTTAL